MRLISTLLPDRALRHLRALGAALVLVAGLSAVPAGPAGAANAPSLPTGAWSITANGSTGTLEITAVDAKGNLSGTALGVPIKGFWNGFARRITFETNKASLEVQVYTGHLYATPAPARAQHTPGLTVAPETYTLVGSFEAFQGTVGTAERSVFGWTATHTTSEPIGTVQTVEAPLGLARHKLQIIANGHLGELNISAVDGAGNVSGTLFGDQMQGFWDPYERKLTMVRVASLSDATALQVYTGYHYTDPRKPPSQNPSCNPPSCIPPSYVSMVVAGQFEAFSGSGATARRNVFGWHAFCPDPPCAY